MCLRSALAVHFTSGAAIEVGQPATQLTRQSTTPSHFVLIPAGEVAFLIPEKQNSDGICFGCRRCFEDQLPLRPKIEKCTYRFGWDFKSMSSESALVAVRFRRS